MAFSKEIYTQLNRQYAQKREAAFETLSEKKERLYQKIPAFTQMERELMLTSAELVKEAASSRLTPQAFEKIKKKNEGVRKKREKLLCDSGYPADYLDLKFECSACEDTGYIGTAMCPCYEKALKELAYHYWVLARSMPEATFENFSFSGYSGRIDESGVSPKDRAKMIFDICHNFAQDFKDQKKSLLLHGPVGVGKTFLSGAMSKELLQNGCFVVYDTAYNIFSAFEKEKFQNQANLTDRYFDCELLMIDDLGTELITPYTVSAFYNLLNTRILEGKKIVINTNLTMEELENAYTKRVTVRLLREFTILKFA